METILIPEAEEYKTTENNERPERRLFYRPAGVNVRRHVQPKNNLGKKTKRQAEKQGAEIRAQSDPWELG